MERRAIVAVTISLLEILNALYKCAFLVHPALAL